MMNLFGDLPPPTSHLRPKQEPLVEEYKSIPLPAPDSVPKTEPEGDNNEHSPDRPDKRRRVDAADAGGLSNAQIAAALAKIASHIGNPDKFPKASGLLRQLLESCAVSYTHRDQLFEAVKAAFADFDNASEASLRRDYMKLCHALSRAPEGLFSRPQRAQLEVYNILGFMQNEMHTDDSFVFNKVLVRIKEAVSGLPPATQEDEEALAELQGADSSSSGSEEEEPGRQGEERVLGEGEGDSARRRLRSEADGEGAYVATAAGQMAPTIKQEAVGIKEHEEAVLGAAEPPPEPQLHEAEEDEGDVEADPFGLDRLLPAPKPRPPPPPPPPPPLPPNTSAGAAGSSAQVRGTASRSSAWTSAQSLVMRRQALIECLITARSFYKTPWARTSVELLVEHYHKHRDRFTMEQQVPVDEMVRFIRQARQARPTGPSQKEINRDTTSFERARSEWSRMHVSTRGKVGAQGDAKTQNWLG